MKVIKNDFKKFTKQFLIYVVITQILIFIANQVQELGFSYDSLLFGYFIIFVMVICIVTVAVYTVLNAIWFNVKSNQYHLDIAELTDGYGLYRFLASVTYILLLTANIITGLLLNTALRVQDLLGMEYYVYLASLFFFIPVLVLVIITIAHSRGKKIVRNKEAFISMTTILVGLYIAGNLYYFENFQQGVAILLILFVPLAILYMSFKDRNSNPKAYKAIILLMCIMASLIAAVLFVTSDFDYAITNQDRYDEYQPELNKDSAQYTTEIVETEYGDLIHLVSEFDYADDQYVLTTENYTYRITKYTEGEIDMSAYKLGSADIISLYDSPYQTEPVISTSTYNEDDNTHYRCEVPYSQLDEDSDCLVDEEIIDVYHYLRNTI
ncbi:hypothetical protein R2F61_06090 [Mollicutes bacterium LVI A0078]|nr:hypothetical protein RZE84_06095 [Mollicutes bacterium LVI A0075]WOO90301.1 hypothetical protein R2F61_06090 [Mollicutes bacterium LVI A0078]